MFYVPYEPKNDPWFLFGQALGDAGAYLARSRDNRGIYRQRNIEAGQGLLSSNNNKINQIQDFVNNYDHMNDTERALGGSLLGYSGLNKDNANQYIKQIQDDSQHINSAMGFNRQHRVHDDGFTNMVLWRQNNPLGGLFSGHF